MPIPSSRRFGALAVLITTLAVAGPAARAQGTATLPPSDLVYRDLDRLSELGFLDSIIVGQRPYSRREIGRILRVARERSNRLGERHVSHLITDLELSIGDGLLRRLETRFSREVEEVPSEDAVVSLFDGISVVMSVTDAERRGFPASHTKPIEATIGSLLPRRLGAQIGPGATQALELSQRVEPTTWLAFTARERYQLYEPRDTNFTLRSVDLLIGVARARYANVALSVGREQIAWAQSADEGLFFASDAPAVDQVSLSSDEPFALPGFLRRLGPTKATLVVADLGASKARSHSKLLAYKVSVQPTPGSELGASFMNHFGGSGGAPSSLGNRLIDFLPFIDIFRRHNYSDTTRSLDVDSDKLLGLDGRLRLGGLRGVLFTGEMLIDDFDVHRIPKLFTGYGSQTLGITLPRLISPLLSLRLTAAHMGILTYSHSTLTNGISTRGRLLGNELGPDSKAFGAEITWEPTAAARLSIEGRRAFYSNAEYTSFYANGDSTRYVVQKVSRTADEQRDRIGAALLVQSEAGPALSLRIVGERSRNYLFLGGERKYYAAELALHLQQ
ncbi:MAG: Capsule assembly protein Wzi [Gemmatimonadetes bacterium]|nr:Capsule assembly protein Wzi [Gemmatimonadota bacterium]